MALHLASAHDPFLATSLGHARRRQPDPAVCWPRPGRLSPEAPHLLGSLSGVSSAHGGCELRSRLSEKEVEGVKGSRAPWRRGRDRRPPAPHAVFQIAATEGVSQEGMRAREASGLPSVTASKGVYVGPLIRSTLAHPLLHGSHAS